jgi:hypothetical protein
MATKGGVSFWDIAYTLPYAQGLQLIWEAKCSQGDYVKATWSDKIKGANKQTIDEILG